jgi:hypothetical protein
MRNGKIVLVVMSLILLGALWLVLRLWEVSIRIDNENPVKGIVPIADYRAEKLEIKI